MKILVTGAGGMFATAAVPMLQGQGHTVIACPREVLDLTRPDVVQAVLRDTRPDLVLNTAAYTRVDDAEHEPERAWAVNAAGVRHLAQSCQRINARLVHLSTDYIFDGQAHAPYDTDAPAQPLNVYGQSKWAGEQAVRENLGAHYIVRTAWLYGTGGPNFVDTMRRLARSQSVLRVVNDQFGAPTWTVDLARAISALIHTDKYGTYHISNSGQCSWHAVAERIVALEGLKTPVIPVSSAEFPRPATRPSYSVLSNEALLKAGVGPLPRWEDSLAQYLRATPL
jgi:dTDP-4-dehydrorhamnose reductase